MKKIFLILPVLLLLTGCGIQQPTEKPTDAVSTVAGIQWDKPFGKNPEIENTYKNSTSLPSHHTLCVPSKMYLCNGADCKDAPAKVFDLIGGTRENPTISRCDTIGCDTYDAQRDDSGEYKNIQPVDPKGFMLKMSYNSVDKKYLEIATLGLDVYLTYGYCLYDFELPKSTK